MHHCMRTTALAQWVPSSLAVPEKRAQWVGPCILPTLPPVWPTVVMLSFVSTDSGARHPRFKSWLCHMPCLTLTTSLCLSFLICKREMIITDLILKVELLWKLNESIHIKFLEPCLAYSTSSLSVCSYYFITSKSLSLRIKDERTKCLASARHTG